MTDHEPIFRASAAGEPPSAGKGPEPAAPGRFAPYPSWLGVVLLIRGAQIVFLICFGWYMAAFLSAGAGPRDLSTPPVWLFLLTGFLGASTRGEGRFRTSPIGDVIGGFLASPFCPACGQDAFDHRPPSGYAPEVQRHRMVPSRICTNCGHDLKKRTAA